MLDYKKLRKECVETIHSFSKGQLLKWFEFDNQRIAQAEQEDTLYQPAPRMAIGKLNGSACNSTKSNNVPVKKTVPPSKVRARNSAKARATTNNWSG